MLNINSGPGKIINYKFQFQFISILVMYHHFSDSAIKKFFTGNGYIPYTLLIYTLDFLLIYIPMGLVMKYVIYVEQEDSMALKLFLILLGSSIIVGPALYTGVLYLYYKVLLFAFLYIKLYYISTYLFIIKLNYRLDTPGSTT